jgi:hypothetical protein
VNVLPGETWRSLYTRDFTPDAYLPAGRVIAA